MLIVSKLNIGRFYGKNDFMIYMLLFFRLVINISGNDIEKGETLSDYMGSGPLKDTGKYLD